MSRIDFKNVCKRYAPNAPLTINNANLTIENGEFCVFVGPSGCGKSTLLRMVAGLEDISGGDICIGERVVNTLEPAERDIAMVFQNYALYPHMSVFDNMAYGLKIRGFTKADIAERVKKAAEGAALGTGTRVEFEAIGGVYSMLPNEALMTVMDRNLRHVGGITWTPEEIALATEIQKTLPTRPDLASVGTIEPAVIGGDFGG